MAPRELTPSGWDVPGYESFAAFLRAIGAAAGERRVIERDGLVATVVPETPERSLFNSVLYADPAALEEHYAELEDAYDGIGAQAWVVWAPESDERTNSFLEERGHAADGAPRMMAMDLAPAGDWEDDPAVSREFDWDSLCAINDAAYGYDTPTWGPGMGAECAAAVYRYGLDWEGRPASGLLTVEHGGDCGVYAVATLPTAHRRGLAGRAMRQALVDARRRGCETSTLQASSAGAPLYARLGYEDLGAIVYRERRRPA